MNVENIIEFVENDKRSTDEVFDDIVKKIQKKYDGKLTEKEAIEAARRLINLFELFATSFDSKTMG